jgi:hypothetical protein
MAVATSTNRFRQELADQLEARLGNATMVFGSGGVDGQGKVISPDPAQTDLIDPRGEFTLNGFVRKSATDIDVTGRLNKGDLVGIPISEAGVKVEGSLYAIRNFAAKTFETDEYFDVTIEIKF